MGIGFEVLYSPHKPMWVPVDGTATLAVGMVVYYGKSTPANTGGVIVMPAASGADDATNKLVPYGVIIGTSDKEPSYTTLTTANIKVQTIAGTDTALAQLARSPGNVGVEGMYAKGDPQPFVNIMRITPETILKGYFRGSATVGTTAISTVTASGTPTTTSITVATTGGFTAVAENATAYCVKGNNAGLYRRRTDTDSGTTAMTFTRAWPTAAAAGDTFKTVNVAQGFCRMTFDTTYGMWIDQTAALSSHYYVVNVLDMDLSVDSGEEWCAFQFSIDTFLNSAITRT
jgi:hypothetical protein